MYRTSSDGREEGGSTGCYGWLAAIETKQSLYQCWSLSLVVVTVQRVRTDPEVVVVNNKRAAVPAMGQKEKN